MRPVAICVLLVPAFAGTVRRIKAQQEPPRPTEPGTDEDPRKVTPEEENVNSTRERGGFSFDQNSDMSTLANSSAEFDEYQHQQQHVPRPLHPKLKGRKMTLEDVAKMYGMEKNPDFKGYVKKFPSTMSRWGEPIWVKTPHGDRNASNTFYHMIGAREKFPFRRFKSDQIKSYYFGKPLKIIEIVDGAAVVTTLGPDTKKGHVFQKVIKAGTWWGAVATNGRSDFFFGSIVLAPAYNVADVENGKRDELLKKYPGAKAWIMELHPASEENVDSKSVTSFDQNNDTSVHANALAEFDEYGSGLKGRTMGTPPPRLGHGLLRNEGWQENIVKTFGLKKLDGSEEYVKDTFRSWMPVETPYGERRAINTLYHMVGANEKIPFARSKQDQIKSYFFGKPLKIIEIVNGAPVVTVLGPNIAKGHVFQKVIKAGTWWGCVARSNFFFGSDTFAPALDDADFEEGKRDEMLQEYPGAKEWIMELHKS